MTERKFYEKTFTVKVVSMQPVESPGELARIILEEDDNGAAVWCSKESLTRTLNGQKAAMRLVRMGATPDLFHLDWEGNDAD